MGARGARRARISIVYFINFFQRASSVTPKPSVPCSYSKPVHHEPHLHIIHINITIIGIRYSTPCDSCMNNVVVNIRLPVGGREEGREGEEAKAEK